MTDPKEIARHSKRNNNHCIIRFSKAMFWCLQQREAFTFADFVRSNPEFKTVSPYRVLGIWVKLEILEADQSARLLSRSKPVQYKSKWITKNRAEMETRYGHFLKGRRQDNAKPNKLHSSRPTTATATTTGQSISEG